MGCLQASGFGMCKSDGAVFAGINPMFHIEPYPVFLYRCTFYSVTEIFLIYFLLYI